MSDDVVLASWTSSPYTSHDKRHIAIHHRVRIINYDANSTDVVHERREGNDEWSTVAVVEIRQHGMTHQKLREGVLQE